MDAERFKEKMRPGVYVVIAAFNEERAVGEVLQGLAPFFSNVVVVDDGSADDTAEKAREAGAKVIVHPLNLGQGAALRTGMEYALLNGARYVVTFDADGQHGPSDAAAMADRAVKEGLDVLLGSRFLGGAGNVPVGRRVLLRAAAFFESISTGARLTDAHNGLRVLSRDAAGKLDITLHGMSHASEITRRLKDAGFRLAEHPVNVSYSDYSRGKGQRGLNAVNILSDLLFRKLFG